MSKFKLTASGFIVLNALVVALAPARGLADLLSIPRAGGSLGAVTALRPAASLTIRPAATVNYIVVPSSLPVRPAASAPVVAPPAQVFVPVPAAAPPVAAVPIVPVSPRIVNPAPVASPAPVPFVNRAAAPVSSIPALSSSNGNGVPRIGVNGGVTFVPPAPSPAGIVPSVSPESRLVTSPASGASLNNPVIGKDKAGILSFIGVGSLPQIGVDGKVTFLPGSVGGNKSGGSGAVGDRLVDPSDLGVGSMFADGRPKIPDYRVVADPVGPLKPQDPRPVDSGFTPVQPEQRAPASEPAPSSSPVASSVPAPSVPTEPASPSAEGSDVSDGGGKPADGPSSSTPPSASSSTPPSASSAGGALQDCLKAIPKLDLSGLEGRARARKARKGMAAIRESINACFEEAGMEPPMEVGPQRDGGGRGMNSDGESRGDGEGPKKKGGRKGGNAGAGK